MANTVSNAINESTDGVVIFNAPNFTASPITQHNVLVAGASNSISSVAPSTSGNVLTSNGTDWVSSPSTSSGSWVLIQTQNAANSATIDFTTGITSTYTSYVFVLSNVVPANNNIGLLMDVSVNGGSTYISTNYASGDNITQFDSTTWNNTNTTAHLVITGGIQNSNPGLSGTFWLANIASSVPPSANWNTFQWNGSRMGLGAGYNTTTSGVNAFRWYFGSGNITSGKFSLYGIKQ